MTNNPFAAPFDAIPFDQLQPAHFRPALEAAIVQAKDAIHRIRQQPDTPTFANTVEALERSGRLVDVIARTLFNLNAAETSADIQRIAKEVSPLLSAYQNDIMLDAGLFDRVKRVYEQRESLALSPEAHTLLEKTYNGFVRNGANLNDADKKTLRDIDEQLSQLSLEFSEHVLNEINAYVLEITNPADLAGLPESAVEAAAIAAQERNKPGSWVFTLHHPSYLAFMTYADNRPLREQLFRVFASRNFHGGENDNQAIVLEIVRLRHQRAQLLGYDSHAGYVLEERMAESPDRVRDFLGNLLAHAKPAALREVAELSEYARRRDGLPQFERWDFSYYSEKLKKEKFAIDDELLKPYFPLENVVTGVFTVAHKLYGLTFTPTTTIAVYHPDVTAYDVTDAHGHSVGVFYTDFFPRAGKKNGAWMTIYQGQYKENQADHRPHVSIVCNFAKPTPTRPSLLTFNEVTTLFHEFGHSMHGLLADGTYESLSGTNVYWDFVELPSQIMENWVYEPECLDLFARHYQTGEKIPVEYVRRIRESANYLSGYQTVRQVSLAQLDMAWHSTPPDQITSVDDFERRVMADTQVLPVVAPSNTSCSFNHIFYGGYASGYYSYKWAEVLDADAFEFFQEKGIFNPETATLFRAHVLSAGGSEHPMTLYKRFRGKEPAPDALLRRSGLLTNVDAPVVQPIAVP